MSRRLDRARRKVVQKNNIPDGEVIYLDPDEALIEDGKIFVPDVGWIELDNFPDVQGKVEECYIEPTQDGYNIHIRGKSEV